MCLPPCHVCLWTVFWGLHPLESRHWTRVSINPQAFHQSSSLLLLCACLWTTFRVLQLLESSIRRKVSIKFYALFLIIYVNCFCKVISSVGVKALDKGFYQSPCLFLLHVFLWMVLRALYLFEHYTYSSIIPIQALYL